MVIPVHLTPRREAYSNHAPQPRADLEDMVAGLHLAALVAVVELPKGRGVARLVGA